MQIIIIGPRSVGKSTIGKELAKKAGTEYFDLDDYVEKFTGEYKDYVKKYGEEAYRKEEEKRLREFLSNLPLNFVISIGGGTIASDIKETNERNKELLALMGNIIYLCPSENPSEAIEILYENEQKRRGNRTLEEIEQIYEKRRLSCENFFDTKIITTKKSLTEIVNEIIFNVSP